MSRTPGQQECWDEAQRAYRQLELAMSKLKLRSNADRCYALETGLETAMGTMAHCAKIQLEDEKRKERAQIAKDFGRAGVTVDRGR